MEKKKESLIGTLGEDMNEFELIKFCERLIPIMVKKSLDKLAIATELAIVSLVCFVSIRKKFIEKNKNKYTIEQ